MHMRSSSAQAAGRYTDFALVPQTYAVESSTSVSYERTRAKLASQDALCCGTCKVVVVVCQGLPLVPLMVRFLLLFLLLVLAVIMCRWVLLLLAVCSSPGWHEGSSHQPPVPLPSTGGYRWVVPSWGLAIGQQCSTAPAGLFYPIANKESLQISNSSI